MRSVLQRLLRFAWRPLRGLRSPNPPSATLSLPGSGKHDSSEPGANGTPQHEFVPQQHIRGRRALRGGPRSARIRIEVRPAMPTLGCSEEPLTTGSSRERQFQSTLDPTSGTAGSRKARDPPTTENRPRDSPRSWTPTGVVPDVLVITGQPPIELTRVATANTANTPASTQHARAPRRTTRLWC